MTAATKSKDKTETAKPIVDFMPKWAKEEKCFKEVVLRDVNTKKIIEGGWPRLKPTEQSAYERWLSNVVNSETGEFHMARNDEGIPIKGTGAKYVVTVITRVRDQSGKKEYLYTKGRLDGFDASGRPEIMHIAKPEVWSKTEFAYERIYSEKTGSFTSQTSGPSKTYQVFEIPFSPENVKALYDKTEDEDVLFVLKDMRTGDARSLIWSSVKDSLDLFCNKPFEYLWKADYIPAPVKAEYRQEAVAQGLIKGVASDYQMQSSPSQSSSGVE